MKDITDKEFNMLRELIKRNYGINLGDEKKSLVYSRLRVVLQELNMTSFTQYYEYLVNDKTGGATQRFVDRITTNHTFFMREADHFYYLRDNVLPYIEKNSKTKDFRLWCAASSSGEEPYTLQIIAEEFFKDKPGWNTETLATDISEQVLDKATAGVYTNEGLSTLPAEWRTRYFKKYDGAHMQAVEALRNKIIYRKFNLMSERFPFKKPFQVIFVRNVMIYFDNETRDKLVDKFYDCMDDGGYLFIGHSESLNHTKTRFKYIQPALYRKMEKVKE